VFDLAAVTDVDSSGLAVLFGWQRAAQAQGKTLKVTNPPASLVSLAEVYGTTELLPLS
jgi:phospholipid transport system transporter-binding protein